MPQHPVELLQYFQVEGNTLTLPLNKIYHYFVYLAPVEYNMYCILYISLYYQQYTLVKHSIAFLYAPCFASASPSAKNIANDAGSSVSSSPYIFDVYPVAISSK